MREELNNLLSLRWRDVANKVSVILVMVNLSLVLWTGLTIAMQCHTNLVVVLSGSMEPGYVRGDIVVLHNLRRDTSRAGDIVVFSPPGTRVPIVHRIIRVHKRNADGMRLLLTKGDNNNFSDVALYPYNRDWIEEERILSKPFLYFPRIGYLTLVMSELPYMRYTSFGLVLLYVLVTHSVDTL